MKRMQAVNTKHEDKSLSTTSSTAEPIWTMDCLSEGLDDDLLEEDDLIEEEDDGVRAFMMDDGYDEESPWTEPISLRELQEIDEQVNHYMTASLPTPKPCSSSSSQKVFDDQACSSRSGSSAAHKQESIDTNASSKEFKIASPWWLSENIDFDKYDIVIVSDEDDPD